VKDQKFNEAKLKIYDKMIDVIGGLTDYNPDILSFIKAKKDVLTELDQLQKIAAAALNEVQAETEVDAQEPIKNGPHLKDDFVDIQFVKDRQSTEPKQQRSDFDQPKAPKWIVGDFAFVTFEYDPSFDSWMNQHAPSQNIHELSSQPCEPIVPASVPDCTCDSKVLVSYGCQCDYRNRKLAKKV
jgi:hypothetical protein